MGFDMKGINNFYIFLITVSVVFIIFVILVLHFDKSEPKYIPNYITLRDNLTMPDGRTYWDNNNKTDMLIASEVLKEYLKTKDFDADKSLVGERRGVTGWGSARN